jgi:hypothetical protein
MMDVEPRWTRSRGASLVLWCNFLMPSFGVHDLRLGS